MILVTWLVLQLLHKSGGVSQVDPAAYIDHESGVSAYSGYKYNKFYQF